MSNRAFHTLLEACLVLSSSHLFFFLKLFPFSPSNMNSLPPREDVENRAGPKICFYCNKVFNNYQALGGHLRIHQQKRFLGTGNSLGRLSNSFENSRYHPVSVPNRHQHFSSGLDGNLLTSFARTTSPFGLPRMFCTNEMNQADMSNCTGNNPRFARIPSISSQNFSYGSSADSNYLSSCLSATASAPLPRMAFALSGTGSSSDLPLNVGSNAISQFNTDSNFWTCRYGLPYSPLEFYQGHNFRTSQYGLPYSPLEYYEGHNSGPNLCFSVDKGQGGVLTGDKRSFLGVGSAIGGTTNISKKQKTISEESRKIELPPFVNVDATISLSDVLGAETEGQEDVDLSLHL